jgi:microcystin-dependent protein
MDPYTGEIRIFAGNYAPTDWQLCDGTTLPVSSYEALFSLIGTYYGGDGVNTFNVPDLRGRLAISQGQGPGLSLRPLAQQGGTEQAVLDASSMTAHTHTLNAAGANASTPTAGPGVTFANTAEQNTMYVNNGATPAPNKVSPAAVTIGNAGAGQAHDNIMPSLALNYIICLNGIYPQAQ